MCEAFRKFGNHVVAAMASSGSSPKTVFWNRILSISGIHHRAHQALKRKAGNCKRCTPAMSSCFLNFIPHCSLVCQKDPLKAIRPTTTIPVMLVLLVTQILENAVLVLSRGPTGPSVNWPSPTLVRHDEQSHHQPPGKVGPPSAKMSL